LVYASCENHVVENAWLCICVQKIFFPCKKNLKGILLKLVEKNEFFLCTQFGKMLLCNYKSCFVDTKCSWYFCICD
jgi:hypothetical protein